MAEKKKMTIGEIVIAQQKQINALAARTDALLQIYNQRGEVLKQIIKAIEDLKNGMEITVGEENVEPAPEPEEEIPDVPETEIKDIENAESEPKEAPIPNAGAGEPIEPVNLVGTKAKEELAPNNNPEQPKEIPVKEGPAATFPPRA